MKHLSDYTGNAQKYVSANRHLLPCKTLPAQFSNKILANYLPNFA